MAGERQDSAGSGDGEGELPGPVAQADAGPDAQVEVARRAAVRLLAEGAGPKAFAELVRVSRSVPMTARLASALAFISLRAGTEAAAITLLTSGVEDAEGAHRIGIRRQLARLLRRSGALERAREQLVFILAEKMGDRRARTALNSLLDREERWEELDASLEKETKEAMKSRRLRGAARATLWRARLWSDRFDNPGHAAVRYGQAAQLLEQARDFQGAFHLRLLWLKALKDAGTPPGSIDDAVKETIEAGDRVGAADRARGLAKELGLVRGPQPFDTPAAVGEGGGADHLIAAAEEASSQGKQPEAAALLAAAANERPDPETLRKMESHFVARGAWRELAAFYRDRIGLTAAVDERAELMTRLAELLEDELADLHGAAKVYADIAQLTGDKRAMDEQIRLLRQLDTASGVKRALDEAVERASEPPARANALVTRGEAALMREEYDAARRDFEAALAIEPDRTAARVGLAEAAAALGDTAPILALEQFLGRLPRQERGRSELYRRLARLAQKHLPGQPLARNAWAEVLADVSLDPEAQDQLAGIARSEGDGAQLERSLRAKLRRDPRAPDAGKLRLELVAVLDGLGRTKDADEELMQAVRFDPGHRDAWRLLADRYLAAGDDGRAGWALEHAASATEDPAERATAWAVLAEHHRTRLGDPVKARIFSARADSLRADPPRTEAPRPLGAAPSAGSSGVLSALPRAVANAALPKWDDAHDVTPKSAPSAEPVKAGGDAASEVRSNSDDGDAGARSETPLETAAPDRARAAQVISAAHAALAVAEPVAAAPRPPTTSRPSGARPAPHPALWPAAEPVDSAAPTPAAGTPTAEPGTPPHGTPAVAARTTEVPFTIPPEARRDTPLASHVMAPDPGRSDRATVELDLSALAVAGELLGPGSASTDRPAPPPPRRAEDRREAEEQEEDFIEPSRPAIPAPPPDLVPPTDLELEQMSGANERYQRDLAAALRGPKTDEFELPLSEPPPVPEEPQTDDDERARLFAAVRAQPLDTDAYHQLADYFDRHGDVERGDLMAEIATALEGVVEAPARVPRLILSARDRAGLRHPLLRNEAGELLTLCGVALCNLFPSRGRAAGSKDAFHLDTGPGAQAAAEAVLAGVRILGLRAPDLYLSEDAGPPFSIAFPRTVRMLVGRAAVLRPLPGPELRFFAGRALVTQGPDLLALRSLTVEQLDAAFRALGAALFGGKRVSEEAWTVREGLNPKTVPRLRELYSRVKDDLDLDSLAEGARHSANRAGLVVAGAVAPALAALRAKKALDTEIGELIRFAGSERYLKLRMRRIPG